MFTQENTGTLPDLRESSIPSISDITFKIAGIEKLLTGLDTNKSNGPDENGIPLRILKEYASEIAPMLTFIVQQSYDTGTLPDDWKKANVVALFKKGDRSKAENYRPVSLTAVACKMMEHVIRKQIMIHLNRNNILVKFQHGFRAKHSCESQLIMTVESIQRYLKRNKQVDVLVLDFSKAIDTHQRLLLKLDHYGIRDKTLGWIRTWLTNTKQRVVVDGDKSEESSVTSGVPQGTVLGPLMFLLHINDIRDDVSKGTYIKLFTDDCLLFRETDSLSGAESLENDLQSLVKWSKTWQMSVNVSKCHALKICKKKNPIHNE